MKKALVFIAGLLIGAGILFTWALFQIKHDTTNLPNSFVDAPLDRLPFDGEWFVFWGGEKADQNAHHGVPAQNLALDLVIVNPASEKTHKTNGKSNEDYLCWIQPVFAAHNGKVIISVDGIPDNQPGKMNPQMVYGNTVMIQHESGFVSVYAHLKLGSVLKRAGDIVRACPRRANRRLDKDLRDKKSGHGRQKRLPCPKFGVYDFVITQQSDAEPWKA